MIEKLDIKTSQPSQMLDITAQIQQIVTSSKVKSGVCCIYSPHTTAAVTVNENADPSVQEDILNHLSKSVPHKADYLHAEGNSDSHIKTALIGPSTNLIIADGKILLGTWQGVFLCEFDGPRKRSVWVKIVKE